MGEAKGPGERTSALHLGTWLYIDIQLYGGLSSYTGYIQLYRGMCNYTTVYAAIQKCVGLCDVYTAVLGVYTAIQGYMQLDKSIYGDAGVPPKTLIVTSRVRRALNILPGATAAI